MQPFQTQNFFLVCFNPHTKWQFSPASTNTLQHDGFSLEPFLFIRRSVIHYHNTICHSSSQFLCFHRAHVKIKLQHKPNNGWHNNGCYLSEVTNHTFLCHTVLEGSHLLTFIILITFLTYISLAKLDSKYCNDLYTLTHQTSGVFHRRTQVTLHIYTKHSFFKESLLGD